VADVLVLPCADKKKPGKNPFVDTTFLPDREREEEERKIREQLSVEWEKEQEKVKSAYLLWLASARVVCRVVSG
jgi:hypothetical protein